MRKEHITSSICFLLLSFCLQAQLCWKVSGNGLKKNSYLFGTHHIIDCTTIPHFNEMLELCASTEAVVGELVLDDSLNDVIAQGISMDNNSLSTLLTADEYKLVDAEMLRVLGASLDLLNGMKPLYVSSVYSVMSYMHSLGISEQPISIDEVFQRKGKEVGLKIIGLETPQEQLDLLYNTIPVERQAKMLVEAICEKDETNNQAKELNEAYLAGDLTVIEKIAKGEQWTPDEKILFADLRNTKWLNELPIMLKNQSCFVAVGCLHLVGETGLINQLRLAGFTVEPMQFN